MESKDNETLKDKITGMKRTYPSIQSVLMPALYAVEQSYGWLSQDAIQEVSNHTGVPAAEIKGVATFYSMYRHEPMGRHLVQLCTNVSCLIAGVEDLVKFLDKKYGLLPGGTTKDGRLSLCLMECIGACGNPPAMLVDGDAYDNLTCEAIEQILEKYE
ncbi:MAG: NADH-quinone oxidoreductase subunit NuoE [Nitrospirae bacterium]|nr:NADH-quinone oxidoreductase subunit NuoE [Nitrospirota bacterium]